MCDLCGELFFFFIGQLPSVPPQLLPLVQDTRVEAGFSSSSCSGWYHSVGAWHGNINEPFWYGSTINPRPNQIGVSLFLQTLGSQRLYKCKIFHRTKPEAKIPNHKRHSLLMIHPTHSHLQHATRPKTGDTKGLIFSHWITVFAKSTGNTSEKESERIANNRSVADASAGSFCNMNPAGRKNSCSNLRVLLETFSSLICFSLHRRTSVLVIPLQRTWKYLFFHHLQAEVNLKPPHCPHKRFPPVYESRYGASVPGESLWLFAILLPWQLGRTSFCFPLDWEEFSVFLLYLHEKEQGYLFLEVLNCWNGCTQKSIFGGGSKGRCPGK